MSGRRRLSFRSGDLAENLGILLVRGVATVAEVPRPEDVGIDAVANLLRNDPDGNCYAEDGFLVQFKSISTESIEYSGHELEWFLSQSLPLFLGLADLKSGQLSLYSTIYVHQAVLSMHASHVVIRFGPSGLPPFVAGATETHWKGEGNGDVVTVWLGSPILQWSLANFNDPEWRDSAYLVLKRFLEVARQELEFVQIGRASVVEWLTNDVSSIRVQQGLEKGRDLQGLVRSSEPLLRALALSALAADTEHGNQVLALLGDLESALNAGGNKVDFGPALKLYAIRNQRIREQVAERSSES